MVRQRERGQCLSYQEDRIGCELAYGPVGYYSHQRWRRGGGGGGEGGGVPYSGGSDGGGIGQVATKTLSSKIFHLQQIVRDMRNKVISSISDQRKHINMLNVNIKCIALAPGVHGRAAEPPTTA